MENKEFTFWKLISDSELDYTIEIPAIQRDYVQDRLYSDFKKADCDIVGDIQNSLTNQTKINLHFVYGKVDNQELIPLDGQQRLTTLFLLHWFLSLGTLSDNNKKILSKFTYETRPSSEDFCRKLVNESIVYESGKKISEQVSNTKWFFLSWKNDPTIKAMLNMLDVIQEKFNEPSEKLFNLLCNENCYVTFHFLPLQQFKLDDEIYVKMNSRGKPLTDFENFKANFSVLFDQDNKSKLDNEWLDIFWMYEKNNEKINLDEVDKKYLKFIENISLCFWSENKDFTKEERDNFNIFNEYKEIYSSDSEYLKFISKILDSLKTYEDTQNYFESFLKPNPDYWEYLRFYSVAQFFIHCGIVNNTNIEIYNKWIRVCRNLINNSLIQAPDEFYKAIRSIKDLATHIQHIYEYLVLPETKIVGFLQSQVEEEKTKAKLILNDNLWNEVIEQTERHFYFDGQIGFILNFIKNDNRYDLDQFSDYSKKMSKLFSSEFQDNYDCLFQRSLLTFGDYLVPISGHFTFCNFERSLRAKMDNWRKVFNEDTKSTYLKQLLDTIKIDSIKNDLQTIVNNFQGNDWSYLFIKNKGIIEYCNNYQIDKIEGQIYLARSNAKNWRRKAELRSYVFYKTMLKDNESKLYPFTKINYWDSSEYEPCTYIDNWLYKNYHFALDIRYSNNRFTAVFYDRNGQNLSNEEIEILEKIGFTKNIEKVEDSATNTIKEITKSYTCLVEGNHDFTEIENKIQEFVNYCSTLHSKQMES